MTIQYTVYDTATNQILRTGEAMTMEQALLQGNTAGTTVTTVGSDPVTQQVVGGNVVSRPVAGISADKTTFVANGTDAVTISNIPASTVYSVAAPANLGIPYIADTTVSDGTLIITTNVAGTYVVTLRKFPNADYVVTLNAS